MQEAVKPSPAWERVFTNIGVWGDRSGKNAPITPRSSSSRGGFKPPSSPQGKPPPLTEAAIAKHIVPAGDTYPPTPSRCSSGKVTAGGKGIPAGQAAIGRLDAIRRRRRRGGSGGGDCQVFTKYCVNRVDFVKALWERVQGRGDYLTVAATNSVPVEY